jgi:hypothetical protein
MYTSILKSLNGHAGETDSLIQALAQLGRDRESVRADLDKLNNERRQALLDDASDTVLDKLERAIDRATVRLEKLNIAEAPLRERITAAKLDARGRRWQAHRETYLAAANDFLAAARLCAAKHAAVIAIVNQMQREGFEAEVAATCPGTPQINNNAVCAPELLDQFSLALAPPAPAPRRTKLAPTPERAPKSTQGPLYLSGGVPSLAPPPPRFPDDTAPLNAGQARVKVLRAGFSPADDRPQCAYGQIIRMPRHVAERAAASGVVEIILNEGDRA